MSGFDKDEFWQKILSMYHTAKNNNYIMKLDQEQVEELKALYIDIYIPVEKISHYDDQKIIKKMMTQIVSINKFDKDSMTNLGEVIQLVNTVKYDGKNMYIQFAKISPVRMRRFELGLSRQQIAEKMGYSITTIRDCEATFCDLTRQPEKLVTKLARVLQCEPEALMN